MSISQKAGVYAAVCAILGENFEGKAELSKDQRKDVVETVCAGILNGEIEFSAEAREKHNTDQKVKDYTSGMVSNWLRKDMRLNGGEKYEAKNPGSRAGQGDEVLKNLKALRTKLTEKDQQALVDAEIESRKEFLAQAKAKTVTINVDAIPEELRHLIPKA